MHPNTTSSFRFGHARKIRPTMMSVTSSTKAISKYRSSGYSSPSANTSSNAEASMYRPGLDVEVSKIRAGVLHQRLEPLRAQPLPETGFSVRRVEMSTLGEVDKLEWRILQSVKSSTNPIRKVGTLVIRSFAKDVHVSRMVSRMSSSNLFRPSRTVS